MGKSISDFVAYVQKWEGGTSKNTSDHASINPAPGTGGIHTNKGVTWTTFTGLAKKCGYLPTVDNFLKMNETIWFKIFKQGYWNPFNLDSLHKTKPSIAYFIAQFCWGSGVGGAESKLAKFQRAKMNISDSDITPFEITANFKKDLMPEKVRLAQLIEMKRAYYVSLNQPQFTKGWLNRLNDFQAKFA